MVHTSAEEDDAAFWLVPRGIAHLCVGPGLLHRVVCCEAMGFRASALNWVLFKTSLFYGENSAGRCGLHRDECGLDAANKLKLHTYFIIKAMRKRRLKSPLYPLPSC